MSVRKRNVVLAVFTRIGVVVALLAIAISVYLMLVRTRAEPVLADPSEARPTMAVIEVQPVPVSRQWQGFGSAAPARGGAANVPAQVRGVVEEISPGIVAGATVERGEVLMRLDDADYRYEVELAEQRIAEIQSQVEQLNVELRAWTQRLELSQEEVKIAQHDLDRIVRAQERGSATQREVDQMRSALIIAQRNEIQIREQIERIEPRQQQLLAMRGQHQAALELARRNLARCIITSPIDGIVQHIDVERGESVGADQRIARIVDLRRIEVPLRLPAAARASIRPGNSAIVRSAGAEIGQWDAVISRIAPEDDQQSRTMTVFLDLEQDPEARDVLTPGKFVQGLVAAGDSRDRIILPRRSIHADRIWLVDDDGRLNSRAVQVAFSIRGSFPQFSIDDTAWVVVDDSLSPGTLVVLDGARSLVEGSRIEPVLPNGEDSAGLAARNGNPPSDDAETERVP